MSYPVSPARAELFARFQAAEARLYPLAVVDPERFEKATILVGIGVRELATCTEIDELLDRCAALRPRLPELAQEAGTDLEEMPLDLILDAAAAMRCRQLESAGSDGPSF